MIDVDWLHASLQYPAAVVLIVLAVAMAMRVRQIRHDVDLHADLRITSKLAILICLLGIKQLYWTVWGALRALDHFRAAEAFGGQVLIPMTMNAMTIVLGLMLTRRVVVIAYGPRAALTMTLATLALVAVMQIILAVPVRAQ